MLQVRLENNQFPPIDNLRLFWKKLFEHSSFGIALLHHRLPAALVGEKEKERNKMDSTSRSWLTIGISLAVIVIYLPYIIASIRTNRRMRREAKRFQTKMAKRAELTGERTGQLLQTNLECIQASGEETLRQIAETHLKYTGRTL